MRLASLLVLCVFVMAACDESSTPPTGDAADLGPVVDGPVGGEQTVDAPTTDGPGPEMATDGPLEDAAPVDGPLEDATKPDGPVVTPDGPVVTPDGPVVVPDLGTAVCGNSVREGAEQCDDGNTINLDGCDSVCKFEQDQRVNYMRIQFAPDPPFCPQNAFGGAFVNTIVQGQVQSAIDTSIADGETNLMFKFLDLDDLSGTADPAMSMGVLAGTPVNGSSAAYDGNNDLDWWYTVDSATIDALRDPTATLAGSITGSVLTAGPGKVSVALNFAGSPGTMSMSDVKVSASVGASSAPTASTGNTPGHLAAEHLDPALQSFASTGQKTPAGAGKLCGKTSTQSLALIPMPSALIGGFLGCQGYSASSSNTILDLLVSGCNIGLLPGTEIAATQPDTDDPTVPPVGAGPPYTLEANNNEQVTTCRDSSNQVVNLQSCLADAAYSTYIKFATGRVIAK